MIKYVVRQMAMGLKLSMVVLGMVVCMAVVGQHAEGALSCRTVVNRLLPCRDYLRKGGAVLSGSCCNGVRSLNRTANNSAARKTACACLKLMAKAYRVNPQNAASLPSKCRVNVGYAISFGTDCNKVH